MSDPTLPYLSWRDYVDLWRAEHEKQHALIADAVNKNAESLAERLAGMNEFREQLRAQASTFYTREIAEQINKALQSQIDDLKLVRARQSGALTVITAGISLLVSLSIGLVLQVL